jgi:WD40 repeat protein
MSSKYDLSFGINELTENSINWEKNDRTKYLINYFVSEFVFPSCISEIIAWYDYLFEAKLDKFFLTEYVVHCTYSLYENKMIIEPQEIADPVLLCDVRQQYPSIIEIPIPTPINVTSVFVLDQAKTILFAISSHSHYKNNSDFTKNYNIHIWKHNTKSNIEDINNWKLKFILSGHKDIITCINNSNDNKLISSSKDKTIRIWDIHSGKCDAILYQNSAVTMFYILSGNLIGSISMDNTIKIWDVQTYECKCTLVGHTEIPDFVTISFNGQCKRIISTCSNSIKIWNMNTHKCIHNITYQNDPEIKTKIYIDQRGKIIMESDDNTIKIISVITGKCDMILVGHTDTILSITMMPDGKIASSSQDKTVRLWDIDTNFENKSYEGPFKITNSCIVSSEFNSVGNDNLVKPSHNTISFLKILPDGRLIGYSTNGAILIWK